MGALVADKDGNLYGTAFFGGVPSDGGSNPGFGLVFKFSPPATQGGTSTKRSSIALRMAMTEQILAER